MGILTKIFGKPGEILNGVGDIIGKFVTDPDKKLEAELALAKLESEFQSKLVDADVEWAKAQADVIKSEATSSSWLARNWRPLLMLVFTYIIFHTYVIAPLFSIKNVVPLDDQMWELLKIGVGGYIVGRSVEKVAPSIAKAIKK